MTDAATRNARRQRGVAMHQALRPQDEIDQRLTRDHHVANVRSIRTFAKSYRDRQPQPQESAFKLKKFQYFNCFYLEFN